MMIMGSLATLLQENPTRKDCLIDGYLDFFFGWFFTDSTMVNHNFAPPFGRICFKCHFSNHRTSKSKEMGGKRSQEWMGMELCMKGEWWLTDEFLAFSKGSLVHWVGVVVDSHGMRWKSGM